MEKSDEGNTSIISFMTILFMVLTVCSVAAATIHFVENGDNLQAVINNAGNSDIIIVESGFYGNVDINKPLNLTGIDIGFGQPLIDAMGNEFGINITADGITVNGFKVTNASNSGIHVTSNNNQLTNNTVTSNENGIHIDKSSGNNIYLNLIYNNLNANALITNNFANNWNSSSFGNYYDDVIVADVDGDGINNNKFIISNEAGTITAYDYHPLVVASKAISPASVSDIGTVSFTISTKITNYTSIAMKNIVKNISLYYKEGSGNWTQYSINTNGIFTFSTTSSGEYYFYTIATDIAGNIENVPNTHDSKTSVTISSGSSSNGGGGGGGGGNSGEAFENILISETEREYVNNGSNVSYRFDLDGNIVRYINFTGLKSSGQISAKVEILRGVSNMVDQQPQDIVYKHHNIWVGNLGWSSPSNIADPTIEFKVDKTWISQNNIDIFTIRLNRYNDGNWEPLETHQLDRDSEFYYFNAKTPGFSPFAVTGKEKYSVPEVAITPVHTAKVKDADNQKTSEETQGSPGFGLTAGLAALVIAIMWRK